MGEGLAEHITHRVEEVVLRRSVLTQARGPLLAGTAVALGAACTVTIEEVGAEALGSERTAGHQQPSPKGVAVITSNLSEYTHVSQAVCPNGPKNHKQRTIACDLTSLLSETSCHPIRLRHQWSCRRWDRTRSRHR